MPQVYFLSGRKVYITMKPRKRSRRKYDGGTCSRNNTDRLKSYFNEHHKDHYSDKNIDKILKFLENKLLQLNNNTNPEGKLTKLTSEEVKDFTANFFKNPLFEDFKNRYYNKNQGRALDFGLLHEGLQVFKNKCGPDLEEKRLEILIQFAESLHSTYTYSKETITNLDTTIDQKLQDLETGTFYGENTLLYENYEYITDKDSVLESTLADKRTVKMKQMEEKRQEDIKKREGKLTQPTTPMNSPVSPVPTKVAPKDSPRGPRPPDGPPPARKISTAPPPPPPPPLPRRPPATDEPGRAALMSQLKNYQPDLLKSTDSIPTPLTTHAPHANPQKMILANRQKIDPDDDDDEVHCHNGCEYDGKNKMCVTNVDEEPCDTYQCPSGCMYDIKRLGCVIDPISEYRIKDETCLPKSGGTRKRRSLRKDDVETMRKKSQATLRAYWNRVHKRTQGKRCIARTTKQYRSRPSPPYPANECCGMTKRGNDGARYRAEPNVNGMCTWKKI
jgi:hypothetical protein